MRAVLGLCFLGVVAACGTADRTAPEREAREAAGGADAPAPPPAATGAQLGAALDRLVADDGSDPAARLAVARLFIALQESDPDEPDCRAADEPPARPGGRVESRAASPQLIGRSEARALLRCAETLGASEDEVGPLRERLRALPDRDRERCEARGQTLRPVALLGASGPARCASTTEADVRGMRAVATGEPLAPESFDVPAGALGDLLAPDPVGDAEPTVAAPECPPPLPEGGGGEWPRDPARLVAHLNRWDTDELELHARPETHPDQAPSGETSGWVQAHLERLDALGVTVAWNARQRCYGITSP